jgi:hypothetical protein
MTQRGRKSAASLQLVGAGGLAVRLAPPAELTEGERAVWLATVNSRPADWFGTEHIPLLVNYARHSVRADVIDQQIRAFDSAWLAEDSGLKRYSALLKMAKDETTQVNNLARAMRLTHQSIYRADKAATITGNSKGQRIWEREEN